MPRLDDTGAVRIPRAARSRMFTREQLDGMWVWLRLAHRADEDCQTYRLAGGGLLVIDETDDAELHLDRDAVAQFMDVGPCRREGGAMVPTW